MARHVRNTLISLHLFALLSHAANLNYSGEAVTTRYWDCCKPSCGWNGKADFSSPVESCTADNKPTNPAAGTGCNGGDAFQCADQQPWAINDTMSYGFAGVYIMPALTRGGIEDAWCCACYQLDFTSDPLIGKSMIIQASNTAYDITTTNRFTLAVSHLFGTLLDSAVQCRAESFPGTWWQHNIGRRMRQAVWRRPVRLWPEDGGRQFKQRLCKPTRAAESGMPVAL